MKNDHSFKFLAVTILLGSVLAIVDPSPAVETADAPAPVNAPLTVLTQLATPASVSP